MPSARIVAVALTILTACVPHVAAVSNNRFDPLSPPAGQIMTCRAVQVSAEDSADVVLEFMDGGDAFGQRETRIAYKTSGTPVSLLVSAPESLVAGKRQVHIVIIQFVPTPQGAFGTLAEEKVELPKPRSDALPPGWNKASSADIERARSLALAFWKRRCKGEMTPPVGANRSSNVPADGL
jgi:hypothetical protein